MIGYSPLSYYDTQSFVAPGIHRLIEEIRHRLLVFCRYLASILVGITPVIVGAIAGVAPWLIVVKFHTHIVVAIAFGILRNDEISILYAKPWVTNVSL